MSKKKQQPTQTDNGDTLFFHALTAADESAFADASGQREGEPVPAGKSAVPPKRQSKPQADAGAEAGAVPGGEDRPLTLDDLDEGDRPLTIDDLDMGDKPLTLDDLDTGDKALTIEDLDEGGSPMTAGDPGGGDKALTLDDLEGLDEPPTERLRPAEAPGAEALAWDLPSEPLMEDDAPVTELLIQAPAAEAPEAEMPEEEDDAPVTELLVQPPAAEAPAWDLPSEPLMEDDAPVTELLVQAPVAEAPVAEAPASAPPALETPPAEAPAMAAPAAPAAAFAEDDAPVTELLVQTPAAEAPGADTPAADAQAWNLPPEPTPGPEPEPAPEPAPVAVYDNEPPKVRKNIQETVQNAIQGSFVPMVASAVKKLPSRKAIVESLFGDRSAPRAKSTRTAPARETPTLRRRRGDRKSKRPRKREHIVKKILKGFLSAILIIVLGAIGYGVFFLYGLVKDLPEHDPAHIQDDLKTISTIYNDQGEEMKDIYIGDDYRMLVNYEDLPQNLVDAVVAIEDKTFWTHHGFNLTRIIGAIRESYIEGGEISGTSTISQQLARNIWLADTRFEYSIERKIREAWYARQLEQGLKKEEILTAYMNTISLGNHSYGVGAAAKSYFNKEIWELDLLECAALAALPASPSKYSLITTVGIGEASPTDPNLLLTTDQNMFLYNSTAEPRIQLVLDEMLLQGYITEEEWTSASSDSIRNHLHPQPLQESTNASFFIDYLIQDVAQDLYDAYPDNYEDLDDALENVYSGGYQIYSTFSQQMQDIATEEFENAANFPVAYLRKDRAGNALDDEGEITLFLYGNLFEDREDGGWFRLQAEEYAFRDDGSMIVYRGNRLGIYNTTNPDGSTEVAVEFRDFYSTPVDEETGKTGLYMTKGGIISIPAAYKSMDTEGNLILSADFFSSPDNVFTIEEDANGKVDENGNPVRYWLIGPSHYTLRQAVIQPQGAMVILEQHTGRLKAMVGGRGIEGQMQFNRALATRQPGSTMKPIGTYGPALDMGARGMTVESNIKTFGTYWTAMSIIVDAEMEYRGKKWPRNWYGGYKGPQTMRQAIEQSENIPAVKVQLAIGNKRSIDFLKKLGITTIVEDGDANDLNPAALALGGMTHGISPLENASAYSTFANEGVHVDPITYTVIKDREGNVVLDGTPKSEEVMHPGAAYIMNDMLYSAVSRGIANRAQVKNVPVAGKTGTSSENYDAWFVGNTPEYSAAVWIGLDLQIKMSQNSAAAAGMFSRVMTRVYEEQGITAGEFPAQPESVIKASVGGKTDLFVDGTVPDKLNYGGRGFLICADSGMLATPWCSNTFTQYYNIEPEEATSVDGEGFLPSIGIAPRWYCPIHSQDQGHYPTGEGQSAPDYVSPDFSTQIGANDEV
ncbi:MAG: transglycosylase domain-containing protein [Clostridiales Family XIII bacterium]|nr:transglycosylase domain-containing protein [Clostridiales Family XIII bacterium]